jgi:hypothetical protein
LLWPFSQASNAPNSNAQLASVSQTTSISGVMFFFLLQFARQNLPALLQQFPFEFFSLFIDEPPHPSGQQPNPANAEHGKRSSEKLVLCGHGLKPNE